MNLIKHYLTTDGKDPVTDWLRKLRDVQAKAAIIRRPNEAGARQLRRFCPWRDGVYELRIDTGRAIVVYYAQAGKTLSRCCAWL